MDRAHARISLRLVTLPDSAHSLRRRLFREVIGTSLPVGRRRNGSAPGVAKILQIFLLRTVRLRRNLHPQKQAYAENMSKTGCQSDRLLRSAVPRCNRPLPGVTIRLTDLEPPIVHRSGRQARKRFWVHLSEMPVLRSIASVNRINDASLPVRELTET
jgi:hypothetical protein